MVIYKHPLQFYTVCPNYLSLRQIDLKAFTAVNIDTNYLAYTGVDRPRPGNSTSIQLNR